MVDNDYESNIEVTSFLELPIEIGTIGDYKRNKRVKRRPDKLKSNTPIVWVDDKNSKIGFADQNYSLIFDKSEIKLFSIQNILPAKGSGGAYLEVNFNDNSRSYAVLGGECKIFDNYKGELNKLTGLEVRMAPEYHDC